jgi:predicted nucleic acid-binding protein
LAKKFGEEYSQLAVAERLAIYTIQVLPFEKDDAYYYGEMLAPIPDAEWSPPGRQWKPEHGEKARFADYAIAAHAGQRDYILVSDDHLMQQPRKDLPLHPKAVGSAGIADV